MVDIHDRIERLRSRVPTPLALLLNGIAVSDDDETRADRALKIAEMLAQSLALIALAEASYASRVQQGLSAELISDLEKPSVGHWLRLLREVLAQCPDALLPLGIDLDAAGTAQDGFRDYSALWKQLQPTWGGQNLTIRSRLNGFLEIRNKRSHSADWKWSVSYAQVAPRLVNAVLELLEALDGLWAWVIVTCEKAEKKKPNLLEVQYKPFQGAGWGGKTYVPEATPVYRGDLYLWDGKVAFRPLWPFARVLAGKELTWLASIERGSPRYSRVADADSDDDAMEAASKLRELLPSLWQPVAPKSADPLREQVQVYARDGIISAEEFGALVLYAQARGLAETPAQARDIARDAIKRYAPSAKFDASIIGAAAAPPPSIAPKTEKAVPAPALDKRLDSPLFRAAAGALGLAPGVLAAELGEIHTAVLAADWSSVYQAIGAAAQSDSSPSETRPTQRLAYGTYGVQLAAPWCPALFVGVIFDGRDHHVTASAEEKGADFVVVVDTQKPPQGAWPGAVVACRQPEFDALRTRLRVDSGGWDFHDHLASQKPNVWHPIHLRRPLATVFAGCSTAAERQNAWLNAAHAALDVVLRGGELAILRKRYAESAVAASAIDGNDAPVEAEGEGARAALLTVLGALANGRALRAVAEELLELVEAAGALEVEYKPRSALIVGRPPGSDVAVRLFYLTHQGTVWAYFPHIEKGGLDTGAPPHHVRAAVEMVRGVMQGLGAGDGKQPTVALERLRGRAPTLVESMVEATRMLSPTSEPTSQRAAGSRDEAIPTLDQLGELRAGDLDDEAVELFLARACDFDGTRGFRRRLNASPREKISELFADRWDNAEYLGKLKVSDVRHALVDALPTIARLHGIREAELREAIGGIHGKTLVRTVVSDLTPN